MKHRKLNQTVQFHIPQLLMDKLDTTYFLPLGLASKQLWILEILCAE